MSMFKMKGVMMLMNNESLVHCKYKIIQKMQLIIDELIYDLPFFTHKVNYKDNNNNNNNL